MIAHVVYLFAGKIMCEIVCTNVCVYMCIYFCILCVCLCFVAMHGDAGQVWSYDTHSLVLMASGCSAPYIDSDYATPKYSAFKPRDTTTRCSASTGERPSRYTLAAAHIPIPRATHFSRSRSACRRAGIIPYAASFAPVNIACMALKSTVCQTW